MQYLFSWLIIIAVIIFVLWLVLSKHREAPHTWPELPQESFVYGRPATDEDFHAGRAAFVTDENIFTPKTDILIPQYAYFLDRTFYYLNKKTPVIVIQVEESQDVTAVGFINLLTGKIDSTSMNSIHLLGTTPPPKFEPYI
ncbi:MAG: hypothetical protein PHN47_08340 [Clostridia bacterium]|jgi:hypothetical protein|nr:hypothetical protein [Clostridia bacterium]MDD4572471.1 hypothetical protein [Clostridia bacterium]